MYHAWDRRELRAVFWWGNLRERDHLEDPGIDGRTVWNWIFGKWFGGVIDWIDLVEDWDRWWSLVNVVMNPKVP